MKKITFEGIVTLESSLSHIGETIGTDSLLRREIIVQETNEKEEVFIISGNSFRGQLRDYGALYFLEKMGINKMPLHNFHFLFSGGSLVAAGSQAGLDLDFMMKIRNLLPFVSVMGGAYGNHIMHGKWACGKMYPLAKECKKQIPPEFHAQLAESWRLWLQEEEYTRTDDAKNVNLRPMIEFPETSPGPQQMRYTVETIAAGAKFYHRMDLFNLSKVELGAFCSALEEFSEKPYLGGMHRIGLGRVNMKYNHCAIDTQKADRSALSSTIIFDEVCRQAKDAYDEYLDQCLASEKFAEIKEVLGIVSTTDYSQNTE